MVRQTHISSKWISRNNNIQNMDFFNSLREALMISIVKIYWLLGRLRVDGFNRQVKPRQENQMVTRRRLIVDS